MLMLNLTRIQKKIYIYINMLKLYDKINIYQKLYNILNTINIMNIQIIKSNSVCSGKIN